jgi:CheY-like chemotaxis protein
MFAVSASRSKGKMILLLAEDEDNDVVLFQRALRKAGVNISLHRVSDGEEAINYIGGKDGFKDRHAFPFPDLVVVDLKMPRKNGIDVIDWVRQSEAKRLRILVLSSSQEKKDVNKAFDSGANAYMTKPHNFEELTSMIKHLHVFWAEVSERPEIPIPERNSGK